MQQRQGTKEGGALIGFAQEICAEAPNILFTRKRRAEFCIWRWHIGPGGLRMPRKAGRGFAVNWKLRKVFSWHVAGALGI